MLFLAFLIFAAAPNLVAETLDSACAPCHSALYERYRQTPMALGSGPTTSLELAPASYRHAPSRVRYSIERTPAHSLQLRFFRSAEGSLPPLEGTRPLPFFFGSGKRGRTFLFETDGFWYQAPINYYARSHTWEMAPGYAFVHTVALNLSVDEGCLFCHTSGVRPAAPGSRNHFAGRPFADSGITCARCHGNTAAHLASGGKAPIMNPAKLATERRDAICAQCHLEGEVSVLLPGRHPSSFQPGDDLFDTVAYFVHASEGDLDIRAVSEVEALAQSVCKRKSGNRLTCTSCHDPHGTVAPAERVSWYRARCLACHTSPAIAVRHHAEQPDCTACHMPPRPTMDIAHEQSTDHRILKRQPPTDGAENSDLGPAEGSSRLVPVLASRHTPRELGLAYATFARKGDLFSLAKAVQLLRSALEDSPRDPAVAYTLAILLESQGDIVEPAALYARTLQLDPTYPGAAAKAAEAAFRDHDPARAALLLRQAFAQDPADSALALRFASAQCDANDPAAAHHTLEQAIRFTPDSIALRSALSTPCASNQLTSTSPSKPNQ